MAYQSIWSIWPSSHSRLSERVVKSLSEEEFFLLCHLVYRRACRRGFPKRKARELVRRLFRRRYGIKPWPELVSFRPNLYFAKYKSNPVLNSLYPEREKIWRNPSARKVSDHIELRNFSFVNNPNETLAQLQKVALAEARARVAEIDFCDDRVLDVGPYMVLGLMSKDMCPFPFGGHMSIPVKKVVEAVELRSFMNIAKFEDLHDITDVYAFRLRHRHSAGTSTAAPHAAISFSKVADELVDTVNEWLGMLPVPFELSSDGREKINKITTEMLENAERHGLPGGDCDWYACGFMARRDASEDGREAWYDCHIAFVNIGDSIGDVISRCPLGQIRSDLEKYVGLHAKVRQSREVLATLYAMQDGVSSLPQARGGRGMMEMVEMTNALGYTDHVAHRPAITVISGDSCIQFRGEYCSYVDTDGKALNRLQPFNKSGRFDDPPDTAYVYDLDYRFPGTIIALRFSLDHAMMEQTEFRNDNN